MSQEHKVEAGRSNIARFFVNHRQVASALLVVTLGAGVAGYQKMPKRKDPDIPVRVGLAICPWSGISADKVEELVTRKMEEAVSGNSKIEKIESTTRDGVAVLLVHLEEGVSDTVEQFADIGQRVTHIGNLPNGAGPVTWVSDFGDTAALMLTVASPKVGEAELRIRGLALGKAIAAVRPAAQGARRRAPRGRRRRSGHGALLLSAQRGGVGRRAPGCALRRRRRARRRGERRAISFGVELHRP